MDAVTDTCHTHGMSLSPRDQRIVTLADRFKQLTTAQVALLVFHGASSRTSCDRALKRLELNGYLRKLDYRRITRGDVGGSGAVVYRLGATGWKSQEKAGRYRYEQAVDEHALDIADTFAAVCDAHRAGALVLRQYQTENDTPSCYFISRDADDGDIYLEPDLFLEIEVKGVIKTLWLEVDRGHQNPMRLSEKMQRYQAVLDRGFTVDEAKRFHGGYFPKVVFVMNDARKRDTLRQMIDESDAPTGLFEAVESSEFVASLL